MDSTVMSRATEANDTLAARADERLAHAYEQIAHADEQLARLSEQMTRMEQDAARPPSAVLQQRPSRGRPFLRGFIGLMAAACIIGGALALQSSYGETAGPAVARWAAPYLGSVSRSPPAKPEQAAQPAPSGVRLAAAADPAPPPAMPLAQAGAQGVAPPAALTPAEFAQLLQTMARDLASVQQGIEQLKAGQEQLAGDNAKAAEQLRSSQEQLTRLAARVSEQEQRAARAAVPMPTPVPRPIAEPARKPVPVSTQARSQPLQLQPVQR